MQCIDKTTPTARSDLISLTVWCAESSHTQEQIAVLNRDLSESSRAIAKHRDNAAELQQKIDEQHGAAKLLLQSNASVSTAYISSEV